MQYNAIVLEHFSKPKNVGVMDEADPHVGTGRVGSSAIGEIIQLQIWIDKKNTIKRATFKAYGNPFTIAASSLATQLLTDKTLTQASKLKHQKFVDELQLPQTKIHSAILIEDAIKAAIKDYKNQ